MNPAIIPAYLDSRMKEMGHCNGYVMRIRHYVLQPGESITIPAYGEIFILLEQDNDVRIESDLGLFSNTAETNEQQYEHTGKILLANLSDDGSCHAQFVQAIPLLNNPDTCTPCNA